MTADHRRAASIDRALTVVVTPGAAGLWYATSPEHRGLLVAEPSVEAALRGVPDALAALSVAGAAHRAATPLQLHSKARTDEFGAHILSGTLGTIGDREIGVGHVVLSEARYRMLLGAYQAETGRQAGRG